MCVPALDGWQGPLRGPPQGPPGQTQNHKNSYFYLGGTNNKNETASKLFLVFSRFQGKSTHIPVWGIKKKDFRFLKVSRADHHRRPQSEPITIACTSKRTETLEWQPWSGDHGAVAGSSGAWSRGVPQWILLFFQINQSPPGGTSGGSSGGNLWGILWGDPLRGSSRGNPRHLPHDPLEGPPVSPGPNSKP